MMTIESTRCCDDVALWPDGSWATLGDISNGDYHWKSDDYEIISYLETERLTAPGVYE
ncbi:hypothetical protein [Sphingobium sp. RAC03]|uniref:hypothetical protein n=1 Tax=Sphingobium sp. RAC03 TaxID=1843368 RepID=UPI0014954A3C|nr:hypothetical protein [Sphingobium sp. RAC03]